MEGIDDELTGHSARRSGAMWYARKGMPVHEMDLLGRWKSSAVFRYIEEALQEIPLYTVTGDQETETKLRQIYPGTPMPATPAPSRPASYSWEESPPKVKPVVEYQKPPTPDQCWAVSIGPNGKTSHRVQRASWNFLSKLEHMVWLALRGKERQGDADARYLASTSKCKRCEAAHQSRDSVKEEISLAQLVSYDEPGKHARQS